MGVLNVKNTMKLLVDWWKNDSRDGSTGERLAEIGGAGEMCGLSTTSIGQYQQLPQTWPVPASTALRLI